MTDDRTAAMLKKLDETEKAATAELPTCTCGGEGLGHRSYCVKVAAMAEQVLAQARIAALPGPAAIRALAEEGHGQSEDGEPLCDSTPEEPCPGCAVLAECATVLLKEGKHE